MRWLADECVDAAIVSCLRIAGHDVVYVAETTSGVSDIAVLAIARDEKRLLLTEDKDFGELVFRMRMEAPGIVLLRLADTDREMKWTRLADGIDRLGERLLGRYTVIEKTRLRSRSLTFPE